MPISSPTPTLMRPSVLSLVCVCNNVPVSHTHERCVPIAGAETVQGIISLT